VAAKHGARIVIVNLEPTYLDERADAVLHADVATAIPALVAPLLAQVV
jgi:NAD-dependent SIR2 family protein deacetylase